MIYISSTLSLYIYGNLEWEEGRAEDRRGGELLRGRMGRGGVGREGF